MMGLLEGLIGKKVTVHSISGDTERQDVGVLEGVDQHFIAIRKSDTEKLYFGLTQVRLIKPFDAH